MQKFRRICVYCGSSPGTLPIYKQQALGLGQTLANQGIELVYGGGNVGLMKAVADGALQAGGQVIGVIPRKLMDLELAHPGIQQIHITESMHQRKYLMAQLSDGFIAMPGGWGTLEELSEVTTWTQLNYHHKAVGLLNVNGYYDKLLEWVATANQNGFIRDPHVGLLISDTDPLQLLQKMANSTFPDLVEALNLKSSSPRPR